MQIIESSIWSVRSVRISLRHPTGGKTIVLFPMVHVGEPEFYMAVYADAFSRDVVLVEGITSPIVRRLTQSYRWVKGRKMSGLVVQPRYPLQENSRARIVQADLDAEEFGMAWSRIPLWMRAALYVAGLIVGLDRRWFGSREKLAEGLALDDAESREEILNWSPETGWLDRAILHARDERLLDRLNEQLSNEPEKDATIAVVYGALHMRAVLRELINVRGFTCTDAQWMPIFNI
jgi:hypothetical protein